ncbi:helix-turn-helix domain-containing protein [Cohnella silvisoli]|uniref:Helix-turn-helix domain-containing protein n=1 Tax=Cohnella silvisoli TaxID=2873699 RepID=A0ABV1KY01_9BACL|nr:helix-turn-helix domain-containing protein [Cohnella silvisoli]MCD9021877.1 helix-turn-helix domain-containing protein [Cohnella silvisoli]
MKGNPLSIIIASVIIGFSIIMGCWLLKDEQMKGKTADINITAIGPLLTIEQTATYLNMSQEQVNVIIAAEQKILKDSGSFSGSMFPYFKINNETYVSKNELMNWIKDVTEQRREYVNGTVLQ